MIYLTDEVNALELSTLFGTRNSSKTNTRGKKNIYGSKHVTTHTTQTKQTLTTIKNWIRKKEEQESSEDPSRGAWEEAFDYFIQQLERNRTCERSEETSSSQESEYSEQDPGEEEEWQEEDEEFDAEEETWKSDSPCHKQEKEKLDGGGDRCRQQQDRRRNKSNRRAEPEGNMDEPVRKCFKASEDMQ